MPDLWMPGAERLDIGDHAPTDGGPAKAIAHITWDRNATAAKPADLVSFASLRSYFSGSGKAVAPHLLWDPWTGRIAQFVPANSRSKSLVDASGGTRTNRAGSVVIQIEALFFPYCRTPDGKVWPKLADTPCKGWDELHAWVKSWGVPDVWPMGRPFDFTAHRSEAIWEKAAGWYAHAHVPENDHQDPGSWPAFPSNVEDDMTPEQAQELKEIRSLVQFGTWGYKGRGKQDAWAILNNLNTQLTAQTAAIKALAGQLGKDVDTATVVAAVQTAIAEAVVKVDVDITGTQGA
ncbi:hypothetical protein [Streptomyces sp. NRRL S-813]|uniref:hypothetical protein n=1 Tax=Streptomyces sp. NRRL S-813 TaxID=1463919 RepID=UPI000AD4A798|nr:hypothetical protein [Streptomyces sp. NRRL S-813]